MIDTHAVRRRLLQRFGTTVLARGSGGLGGTSDGPSSGNKASSAPGDASRAARRRGRGPAIAHRQRPSAQCRLLRMVLLALAGQLLSAGLPPNTWFGHYVARFSTVELNAPFYSWPTVATVESWLRQCDGRPFVYTVKVNELITHTRRFEGTKRLVRDFGLIADLLGPQMGCLLFQLPPSFHYTAARDSIVGQLDPRRRNVVEFRHRSWWHDDVYDAFREAGIIFCSCSGPRLPDELIKTADDIYLRFHGTTKWYRHDYTAGSWRSGRRESGSAARLGSGRTSTTTAKRTRSRTPTLFSGSWTTFDSRNKGRAVPQVRDRARCVRPPEEPREASAA